MLKDLRTFQGATCIMMTNKDEACYGRAGKYKSPLLTDVETAVAGSTDCQGIICCLQ